MIRRDSSRGNRFRKPILSILLLPFALLGHGVVNIIAASRARRRRAARPPDVPIWLRDDVGLPPDEPRKQWWEYR